MKYVFTLMTRLSLRFRVFTLASIVVWMGLGTVAVGTMKQELLPPIEFPQTVVLVQVSGMTSEQVLTVLTERLEAALLEEGEDGNGVDEIINLDSQTTGTFGTVLVASNDFGIDQGKLREEIQAAVDTVWLPLRRIAPPEGMDEQAFAGALLDDMTANVLLYIALEEPNFLFQLSPEVWNAFSEETVRTTLAYLAQETAASGTTKTALERLVERDVAPQVRALESVSSVVVEGGQTLPGEEEIFGAIVAERSARSLLLRLSPEVWEVVSAKLGGLGELDQDAVDALSTIEVDRPIEGMPPALPDSWRQFAHFASAADLVEIGTLTAPVADVFNEFYETGVMVGALGQTDDLTVETVRRMLELAPTLIEYFEADHLQAMPQDVLDVILEHEDYIAGLDGFTRDPLAARALAQSIVRNNGGNDEVTRIPVDLPEAWRIHPPQLISFSFDMIPLAVFSVSTNGAIANGNANGEVLPDSPETAAPESLESTAVAQEAGTNLTEGEDGPPLNAQWSMVALALRSQLDMAVELDTADDLFALADMFGGSIGDIFNQFLDNEQSAAFAPVVLGNLPVDVVRYILERDPSAFDNVSPGAWALLSEDAQALIPLRLAEAWDLLSSQPQFAEMPLETLDDLIGIGNGSAASVLNTINESIPMQFSGYEVRLFDSFTPEMIAYIVSQEPDFYENLDVAVLRKFSPEVLAQFSEEELENLRNRDAEAAETVEAIVTGRRNSAADEIAGRYATNVPPGDPNAPALNAEWLSLEPHYYIELDSADDFFRFPEGYQHEDAAALINSIFDSPRGANFAPDLLGHTPVEAIEYIVARDASVLDNLIPRALQLLSPEALAALPEALQQRAVEGEEFVPDRALTRTDGQPSLFLTVYKDSDSNTVSVYHEVEDLLLDRIDTENDNINIGIVFEQSSFIEESISGVAREGSLGAIFAVVIILLFLSSGVWVLRGRRHAGIVMLIVFPLLAVILSLLGLHVEEDIVLQVLFGGGVVAGLVVAFWPGKLPHPAWRATIVISISIPLSIMMAFIGMKWLSPAMFSLIQPLAEDSGFFAFVLRLFPKDLTLNVMTLSGLTVAIGRVVDDSIVVLENIFRQLEIEEITPERKRAVVIAGTRDVSAAIFIATVVAVVVFLPLGLTGGIIGAFFLPFGLAVTYALAGSFIVAVTVVPVLAFFLIHASEVPEEGDIWIARYYLPVLCWVLKTWKTKTTVLAVAILSFGVGMYLFAQRPAAFLPDMGEPQITIDVEMPSSTRLIETNELVKQMEAYLLQEGNIPQDKVRALEVIVGSGGVSFEHLLMGSTVSENQASMILGLKASVSPGEVDELAQTIRTRAEAVFNCPNRAGTECDEQNVTVSSSSVAGQSFGAFELIVSGPEEDLNRLDPLIIATLSNIEGITNVSSNRTEDPSVQVIEENPNRTIIRVNQESALSYTGELETEDTIGIIREATAAIEALPEVQAVPEIKISQGFQSEIQTEGFNSMPIAMGIATVIVVIILIVTFQSLVYWLALILSIVVAPVGAAVALTLTDRVLGISALIGLLMLLGLVITNAVVLLDRVRSNRTERGMNLYDALVEAGGRRLRPILMTSLATIIALIPLAIGLSEGAIIAAELGTVVIGGVVSSTLLTLIVVPVMYSALTPIHRRLSVFGEPEEKPRREPIDPN